MAFGMKDGLSLDPKIGTWKVEYVTKTKKSEGGVHRVAEEIPM